jgi:predicted transcriptional regulator
MATMRDGRQYVIIGHEEFEHLRSEADLYAIQQGIADMEAGRMSPLDEANARMKKRLKEDFEES